MSQTRTIIATSALPYANGPIHIGHLVEYLQTDYWVRFQKMRGNKCLYICADDTHGAPIMISARDQGITPEELIAKSQEEHEKDFADFQIEFDQYSSTNSDTNKELVHKIYKKIENKKHIHSKSIRQKYCEHDGMFLPDRFVIGTCPKCGATDQYGDNCDKCGATYQPSELKEAQCSICGNTPTEKDSEHLFFKLEDFNQFLNEWVLKHTPEKVSNKLKEWLSGELLDWDISRDEPYFGFEIPGHPKKYFYVWLDAPIGYMSTTALWCKDQGIDFEEFWNNSNTEIFHFIGKDIINFHCLFWPSMLKAAEYKTPDQIFVHGFLTVNGEKMSKSKGTKINARHYLNHLDPTYLRYYFACKLRGLEDIDLSLDDFSSRINSELIGKITNLGSRGAQMLNKKLDGNMSKPCSGSLKIIESAQKKSEEIAECIESQNFAKAMGLIRDIADETNKYFDERAPWKLIKENEDETRDILTGVLNIFRILSIYLKPIIPEYAKKVENLFQEKNFIWDDLQKIITDHKINSYEHIATRIDPKNLDAMVDESKADA